MRLDEAEKILNDNGYELLDEGKLGRALGIGALALGSLVGNANAINQDDIDRFEKQTEMEEQSYYKIDNNNYVERIDATHINYINNFNYKGKDGAVKNVFYATMDKENVQKVVYYCLLNKIPGEKIDSQDLYKYIRNNSSYMKSIKYGSNDDIISVTIYKYGEAIKTLCKDGSVYPGESIYFDKNYNLKNKCTNSSEF